MDNPKPIDMTNTPPFSPASNATAQKLLSSKRCGQIEIWLGETVQYESLQACATDQLCGHASDAPVTSSGFSPNNPTFPAAASSSAVLPVCPVCNRPLESTSPTSAPSNNTTPSKYNSVKTKAMLRGLKTAIIPFSSRSKSKIIASGEETYDPALTTKMFLIPPDGNKDNNDKHGHQDKKVPHPLPSPSSPSSAPSVAKPDSSDDEQDGLKKLLDERMARLKRAQKLLEKSQGRG